MDLYLQGGSRLRSHCPRLGLPVREAGSEGLELLADWFYERRTDPFQVIYRPILYETPRKTATSLRPAQYLTCTPEGGAEAERTGTDPFVLLPRLKRLAGDGCLFRNWDSVVAPPGSGSRVKLPVGFLLARDTHVGVDLGGADISVPQKLLDGAQVGPVIQQVRRKAVAQHVGRDVARNTGRAYPMLHDFPYHPPTHAFALRGEKQASSNRGPASRTRNQAAI